MSISVETDRAFIPANAQATRFLTIEITAPERPKKLDRPPVNIALVLDRSGSMGGRKIELAQKAVAHAIRLLDTRDRLAVVFDDQAEVVLESTAASPEAKALALSRLDEIGARGSTDLHAGMQPFYSSAAIAFLNGPMKRCSGDQSVMANTTSSKTPPNSSSVSAKLHVAAVAYATAIRAS